MAREIPQQPTELMFAPMLYVAWADGDLEDREISAIREQLEATPQIPERCREVIGGWLDPEDRPDAVELAALLAAIRERAGELHQVESLTLRSLAEDLARGAGHTPNDAERRALGALERAIGVAPSERAASILAPIRPPPLAGPERVPIDVDRLAALLAGPRPELRAEILELCGDESMAPLGQIELDDARELTHHRLSVIADRGWGALAFPESCGGAGDLAGFLAAFEALGHGDLSLLVKFGVQFGLFGLAVQMLGTERHHEAILPDAGRGRLPGCFAMTETAHGSNVAELETTAVYDPRTAEFVIDTPHARARKDYIGNAANYARLAVVFAQLETGGHRHGVHAFVVPIRDDADSSLPGVLIEDCGDKLGLDGVDNGRLSFNQVRVGRGALLDRFASVDEDGAYHSEIASPGKRFFTMLGTLVGGRIAVASAAVSATQVALTIAVRYAHRRRQFGPGGAPELTLIEYPHHRRRLMPALARTIAIQAAVRRVAARFVVARSGGASDPEIETAAAVIKALATWNAAEIIGECRQACGGRGYLSDARFADLAADTDVFTTFEGDNVVLLQLVARSLLSGYARGMRDLGVLGMARHVADRARAAFDRNPLTARRTDADHLRQAELQGKLLHGRADDLLHSLARRVKKRIDAGADTFTAMIECQEHALALARAHGERLVFDAVRDLEERGGRRLAEVLGAIRSLYALSALEADRAWFLENGYFESAKSGAVRDQVEALSAELAAMSLGVIDSLAIPDAVIRTPIGRSGER
jgi:acyl-CoA oxidase